MNLQYQKTNVHDWPAITESILKNHPLSEQEIVDVVLLSWERILTTKIGGELLLGRDVIPSPQILGNYLHEMIPTLFSRKYPTLWRKEFDKQDKDMVYIPDDKFSVEIKTSSNSTNIFGNRSYGQEDSLNNSGKKKSGYYITINFDKFSKENPDFVPQIRKIRFGWIDHNDWIPQKSATGQAASLSLAARDYKLKLIYNK